MLRPTAAALILLLCASLPAAASPARPFGMAHPDEAFRREALGLGPVRLVEVPEAVAPDAGAAPSAQRARLVPPAPRARLFDRDTTRFTLATTAAVLTFGYFTWWKDGAGHFTLTDEGFFQEDTYAGGADKASHFVLAFNGEWALENAYRRLGHPDAEARWMAVGAVAAMGVLVEIGDATTFYGGSWEDAVTNLAGALVSSEVGRLGLRDTVGARFGRVKAMMPDPCCRAGLHVGSDYSREVYSLDLKLAGFLPRLGVKPGPARFLLLSLTYGTKGYRFSWLDRWERNVGMDVGLNVPEILRALGVRDETWWGTTLLTFFSVFRVPYTAFGFRYDFNHHKWSGWDTGDHFDPGSVRYDLP